MTFDLQQACDHAAVAAQRAARTIRYHAGRISAEDVRMKGVHDLVTDADEEAQRVIVEHLLTAYPDHAIVAEESGRHEPAAPPPSGFRWVIDPIDGTTNFTRGRAPYAVSIGLQHGDAVVVGVVLDVVQDELFTAVRGGGLRVNGVPAGVAATDDLDRAVLATGFPYRAFDEVEPYLHAMRLVMERALSIRRPGASAIDLAHVACGRFDGLFELGLKPWDVAAGMLLVQEGGGRVSDFAGRPYDPFRPHHLLASNGPIHEGLRACIAEAFGEADVRGAATGSDEGRPTIS